MNLYFIFGYYTGGLRDVFSLTKNLLRFIVHRFNISGLLRTLVSPWKRDVTFHNWRGWHPLLFFKMLFNNFIARFLGMLMRLAMLTLGIFLLVAGFFSGVIFLLLYAGAPLFIVLGFVVFPFSQIWGIVGLLCGTFGFAIGLFIHLTKRKTEPLTLDIRELRKMKFFPRLLARLEINPGFFKKETLRDTETFLAFLETLGIEKKTYERAVAVEHWLASQRVEKNSFWLWDNLRKTRPLGKDWHYAYTPHLDRYCLDLAKYDPTEYGQAELVGRNDELRVATVVLERPTQNSVILVGEPGIGKKTFVHYFAHLIRENAFGERHLDEARVLLFDIGRAMSDAASRQEDPEHFMRLLFAEATYAGNIILAVENIDQYLTNDHDHPRHNLAALFNEFLQLANFRVMATASTSRYHALAKEDEQVLKFFDVIYLRETNDSETLDILVRHFERLERRRVIFTLRGLEAIIASADRYDWTMPLPERAIDLAQEVLLYWRGTEENFITPETVDNFVTLKTGVPSGALKADEKNKLLNLEKLLHQRVIGQNEAVKQVAEAMRKARAGFGNDKRPLGSFIFFGPSGVGKTETAKAFAENYFGNEEQMIRLDMSEFQTPESIDRMIGSRENNVYGELVTAVREHPFSILLLDEIEKAYPRALDLFLQILDEGYVTDGFGEKVNFRNMVIIATSNAGAPLIKKLVREETPMTIIRKKVLDHIIENNIFRLEFLSRFDGIIFFESLKQKELEEVAELKLKKFAERLKKEKNITINFAPDVVPKIVEKGFEPEFGTRSLVRFIEDAIEDAVVKKIIAGELVEGGALDFSGDEL
jgi:ATP-dependent Clp protease ATP-binding subunit ClpA